MTVKISFKTGNAAFANPDEVGRILRKVATQIDSGETAGSIRDIDGNKVGTFKR